MTNFQDFFLRFVILIYRTGLARCQKKKDEKVGNVCVFYYTISIDKFDK